MWAPRRQHTGFWLFPATVTRGHSVKLKPQAFPLPMENMPPLQRLSIAPSDEHKTAYCHPQHTDNILGLQKLRPRSPIPQLGEEQPPIVADRLCEMFELRSIAEGARHSCRDVGRIPYVSSRTSTWVSKFVSGGPIMCSLLLAACCLFGACCVLQSPLVVVELSLARRQI